MSVVSAAMPVDDVPHVATTAESPQHSTDSSPQPECVLRRPESDEPNAPILDCACCRAKQPCAGKLQLDAQQEAQLRRVIATVGDRKTWIRNLRPSSSVRLTAGVVQDDPMAVITCRRCDTTFEIFEWLAAFATEHRCMPLCPTCRQREIAAGSVQPRLRVVP